ncbi:divalent anion:Na+ symporter (DASS) family transporter [Candidatus Epulonipiscium fishelsonii]|uniref:Divalent anion:Na+ symporter (DASS) family transporter n=1 Tax=Candidatus Epulonipiscium fishelsonii TaxID=77094 RepID=A0ACC8XAF1_9FIRM|nr:divalent anion:Na+ symporter (DASS) family transporter [Epulopiscium sp. SCG-B05WGA-EpuloA1]ONI39101.1 divalent anion:Na+ symporter (DASS) family transporter [Epulopiscium sp. SCG-B11WGA-EpuloA1]
MGPVLFLVSVLLFQGTFGMAGSQAIGTLVWMTVWWTTRPVAPAITSLLPIIVNAIFMIVPMGQIIGKYSSENIMLLFGASLLCLPWDETGLGKRIALKSLSIVGPSVKQQIAIWLFFSAIMSSILPNAVVCTMLTPIAAAMLHSAGEKDLSKSDLAVPILLAIAWGTGPGGAGSPLGGAMNLSAITYIEQYTGHEFMYIDWAVRMFPYMLIVTCALLIQLWMIPTKTKSFDGTKEFFANSYKELGPMNKGEKVCATLFILSVIASFTRSLYASLLPGLTPAYAFLILGSFSFLYTYKDKKPLLTWPQVEKNMMWGMLCLFAGGLALGELVIKSGVSDKVGEMINGLEMTAGFGMLLLFVVIARLISEFTNNVTSAAIVTPIVISTTTQLGLNPIPYCFIVAMAFNGSFILPLGVRGIPVGYGVDVNVMLKKGIPVSIVNALVTAIVGYAILLLVPSFGALPYM